MYTCRGAYLPSPCPQPQDAAVAQILLGDVLRITVLGEAMGQNIVNCLSYVPSGAITPPDPDWQSLSVLDVFRTKWRDSMITHLPAAYSVNLYQMEVIRAVLPKPARPYGLEIAAISLLMGTGDDVGSRGAGDVMPPFNAVGLRKITNTAGRNWRGAMRFSPIMEDDQVDQELTPIAIAFFEAVRQAVGLPLNVTAGKLAYPVVFSETLATGVGTALTPPSDFTRVIDTVALHRSVRSQVSRRKSTRGA